MSIEKKTVLHAVETEVDPLAVSAKLGPITVGDPLDFASFAVDQEHLEELTTPDAKQSAVECKKPPKGLFFAVRPELTKPWRDRAIYWILEIEGRDPYLVTPPIAAAKREEEDTIRPLLLVRYVLMSGEEAIWPVKLDLAEGRSNAWNMSALNILQIAETSWVRIVNQGKSYRHQVSNKTREAVPPKFSDRPFPELVKAAFAADHVVHTLDHEIWEILANGSKK